jgi:hypothetical protein
MTKMTKVTCPHCGDVTEQDVLLEQFTCGNCDRPFWQLPPLKPGAVTIHEFSDRLREAVLDGGFKNNPVIAWGRFMEGADRQIGDDTIEGVRISTVFLGLDHGWGARPPVLFETMVFGGKFNEHMDRYTDREAALAGHRRWVTQVRETILQNHET